MVPAVRHRCASALALAATCAIAGVASAATPLPPRDPARSVYDTAQIVDPADEASLEAAHAELFDKAAVAIVLVTVPRLVDETIDELAVRVGQTWGVGKAGSDRGLVIAFARDDRKIFVATGYGTEGYLPDGKVGELLDREALPALRANRFSEGLARLDRALAAVAAAEHGVELTGVAPPRGAVERSPGGGVMTVLGVVLVVFLAIRHPWLLLFMGGGFGGRGGRRGGGGGGFGGFGGGGFGGGGAGRNF